MPLSVQIGFLLALATALASIVGFLYKHRGAAESPPVEWSRPIATSLALFRSRAYTLGILIAMLGWAFHVGALALAPISLVQATIAGSLVLLTVIADRFFSHHVSRREWIGVALAALGLAFLAATLEGTAQEAHSAYEPATLWTFVGLLVAASALTAYLGTARLRAGVLLGAAAGLMWGASDTAIKAASDALGEESVIGILIDPLAFTILAASLVGLTISAKSLQIGPAVPVIAVTSVAANVSTIAAGPIVFAEPMPEETLGVIVRMAAFVLVIGAAAMTPPPVELEEDLPA